MPKAKRRGCFCVAPTLCSAFLLQSFAALSKWAEGGTAIVLPAQVHPKGQEVLFSLPTRHAQYLFVVFLAPSPMPPTHTQTFVWGMGVHTCQLFHGKLRGEPQHFPLDGFPVISYSYDSCSLLLI